MTHPKVLAIPMGLIESLRTLIILEVENFRGGFSLYVCLSKFRENTRQYINAYPKIIGVKPIQSKTLEGVNFIWSVPLASAIIVH